MRMTYRCFVLSLAVLGLAGGARNPVAGAREFVMMTAAQEIALGRESDEQVRSQMGLYDDDELQQYVSEIGLRMAARSHRPDLPYEWRAGERVASSRRPGQDRCRRLGFLAIRPPGGVASSVTCHPHAPSSRLARRMACQGTALVFSAPG